MKYEKPELIINKFETICTEDINLASYTNAAIAGNEVARFKQMSAARTVRVQTVIKLNRSEG